MSFNRTLLIFCLLSSTIQAKTLNDKLEIYPAPQGSALKNDFTVKVRQGNGEWKPIDTYVIKVDEVKGTQHQVKEASMAYFDFSGKVEISVTSKHGLIHSGRVRPLSYDITPTISDSTMIFTLDRPRNLSVEINGDIFHNLHLFAGPIESNKPTASLIKRKLKKNKDLIYFGPGIHYLKDNIMDIPSGKTVYVAGGAIVKGCLRIKNAHNVKIFGRGEVHPDGRGAGISIENSKNISVEGLITTQCPTGGSDSITIRNLKVISSYGWGDGLNIFASNNVLFDGVFCRNSDDCTTVYGTRMGYTGGCRNITMQNSTLWADVAHPIFIGIHGNVDQPEILENLNYVNIDILDHKEKQIDYQGCMAINAGDSNLVRNVRFENIRVEDFRQGQLINLRIFYNKKYCKAPGRGIENILFKNISYEGKNADLSMIIGYDETHKVKNITFDNLKINGVHIKDNMPGKPSWYKTGDMADIFVGEHTENIIYK